MSAFTPVGTAGETKGLQGRRAEPQQMTTGRDGGSCPYQGENTKNKLMSIHLIRNLHLSTGQQAEYLAC